MYSGPGFATGGHFNFFYFYFLATVSNEDEMTTSNTGCADPLGTKLFLRAVRRYWVMGNMRHTPPFSNGDGDFEFPVIPSYSRHWRSQTGEIQQFVGYSKTSLTSASLVK